MIEAKHIIGVPLSWIILVLFSIQKYFSINGFEKFDSFFASFFFFKDWNPAHAEKKINKKQNKS